jgi:hypothetical protein
MAAPFPEGRIIMQLVTAASLCLAKPFPASRTGALYEPEMMKWQKRKRII